MHAQAFERRRDVIINVDVENSTWVVYVRRRRARRRDGPQVTVVADARRRLRRRLVDLVTSRLATAATAATQVPRYRRACWRYRHMATDIERRRAHGRTYHPVGLGGRYRRFRFATKSQPETT